MSAVAPRRRVRVEPGTSCGGSENSRPVRAKHAEPAGLDRSWEGQRRVAFHISSNSRKAVRVTAPQGANFSGCLMIAFRKDSRGLHDLIVTRL